MWIKCSFAWLFILVPSVIFAQDNAGNSKDVEQQIIRWYSAISANDGQSLEELSVTPHRIYYILPNFSGSVEAKSFATSLARYQDFHFNPEVMDIVFLGESTASALVRVNSKGRLNGQDVKGSNVEQIKLWKTGTNWQVKDIFVLAVRESLPPTFQALPEQQSDFELALECRATKWARKLLESDLSLVNAKLKKRYAQYPIHAAANYNMDLIVTYLLDHGANVNQRDSDGRTPLQVSDSLSTAKILIDRGANVNARDNSGFSPASYHTRSYKILALLLAHGAKIDMTRGSKDSDMLGNATESLESCRLLLSKGFPVNVSSPSGRTALHEACTHSTADTPEVIKLLLDHGAIVSKPDNLGNTPLHVAVSKGSVAAIRLLLARGADSAFPRLDGKSALSLAIEAGNKQVLDVVVSGIKSRNTSGSLIGKWENRYQGYEFLPDGSIGIFKDGGLRTSRAGSYSRIDGTRIRVNSPYFGSDIWTLEVVASADLVIADQSGRRQFFHRAK